MKGTPHQADGGSGGSGAGIFIEGSIVGATTRVIENVTLTGNITGYGGVGAGASGFGGTGAGLAAATKVTVRHATIVGNTNGVAGPDKGGVALVGAAIFRGGGNLTLSASSVVGYCGGGALVNGGGNVAFQGLGTCPGTDGDPFLDALAANGGPTDTMRIRLPSPAIDAVPAGTPCAATDQRGVARPSGAACDAGAYEFSPAGAVTGRATDVAPTTVTLNGAVKPVGAAGTYYFEYGLTTAYGSQTPARQTEGGPVSAPLAGLTRETLFHYRLVARNSDGGENGADMTFTTLAAGATVVGGAPGGDPGAPTITRLRVTPRRFRVGPGTTISYLLSRPASVHLLVERGLPGVRLKRGRTTRCVALTRSVKRAAKPSVTTRRARCTAFVASGGFNGPSAAGMNQRTFTGKFGRRALAIGSYRLVAVAADAARRRSAPRRVAFFVIK